MTERVTRRMVIHGRVQGVFFRESMRAEATRLDIAGWVRNRTDGSVEAVVHGTPASVEAIVNWARRGPQDAQVGSVEVEESSGTYSGFKKRPSE
ncbi:MAG: acylphosphatase [Usitatibacter sp.]